jgi:hypothetical protein
MQQNTPRPAPTEGVWDIIKDSSVENLLVSIGIYKIVKS